MMTPLVSAARCGGDELWGTPSRSLGLGPAVAADTSGPVDVAWLAATLAGVLATS